MKKGSLASDRQRTSLENRLFEQSLYFFDGHDAIQKVRIRIAAIYVFSIDFSKVFWCNNNGDWNNNGCAVLPAEGFFFQFLGF